MPLVCSYVELVGIQEQGVVQGNLLLFLVKYQSYHLRTCSTWYNFRGEGRTPFDVTGCCTLALVDLPALEA